MGVFCRIAHSSVNSRCFFYFFFSESPKNLLQDVVSRFFNFIIFLAIIILEKLEMLEIYKKIKLSILLSKKPNFKAKIRI